MVERLNIYFEGKDGITLAYAKAEKLEESGKKNVTVVIRNKPVVGAFVFWDA